MAGRKVQAGGKNSIPARAVLCLIAAVAPCAAARAGTGAFAPSSYLGSLDPGVVWELLIGSVVVASFFGAVGLWILSALRKAKRAQLRRNAFVSSALNHLNQGVVMTDAQERIMFCNDRYLDIYGLSRADIRRNMTGVELLELRRDRGVLDLSAEDFFARAAAPEGLVTELPGGRSVLVKYFPLPNGGSVAIKIGDVSLH